MTAPWRATCRSGSALTLPPWAGYSRCAACLRRSVVLAFTCWITHAFGLLLCLLSLTVVRIFILETCRTGASLTLYDSPPWMPLSCMRWTQALSAKAGATLSLGGNRRGWF